MLALVPAKSRSPMAHIPADHTSNSELMQKKLIVCPISSHDPAKQTDFRTSRTQGVAEHLTSICDFEEEGHCHHFRQNGSVCE